MKNIILTVLSAFVSVIIFAQAPEMLNYQAVVRNSGGELIKNATVNFRISILQATETGTAVYTETHNASTNSQGLVNLKIGGGSSTDNFAGINWAANKYFLKVELDALGGTSYSHYSTSQMLSVPYSLFSEDADKLDGQSGAYYRSAANINAGTLDNARFNAYDDLSESGRLDNSSMSDILLRSQADTLYGRKYAFLAQLSADLALESGASTKMTFTQMFDVGGVYSSGEFTAPRTGTYHVSAAIQFCPGDDATRYNIYLYKNSGLYISNYASNSMDGAAVNRSISITVRLEAGDVLDVRAFQNSGSDVSIRKKDSYFSVCLIY
ncbi:MAG: hypothetical protein JXB00_15415 [Bacteroidales bacterium]|nr:hypothetical protein [Bacteroidales bacterium]